MQMGAAAMSLLMPTFNSLQLRDPKTGQALIEQAVNSLLNQSLGEFELIILDNMSSDGTADYCLQLQQSDPRVRVHVDTENRGPEVAIMVLTTLRATQYCVIVNDDDMWAPNYLEQLHTVRQLTDADLAYSEGRFMSMSGRVQAPINTNPLAVYTNQRSALENFESFLQFRNPFPISFGIWRAELLDDFYPARRFNEIQSNLDNLFIANALRSAPTIAHLNEELFFYRNKPRAFRLPSEDGNNPAKVGPIEIFIRLLIHDLAFAGELTRRGRQADERRGETSLGTAEAWELVIMRNARSAITQSLMGALLRRRASRAEHGTLLAFRNRCLKIAIAQRPIAQADRELAEHLDWLDELASASAAITVPVELRASLRTTIHQLRADLEKAG